MANETATKEIKETKEKLVKVRIPKTKDNQGDVFVSVNDRTWLIQRGKEVDVPECVAEVLLHQQRMEEEALAFEEEASRPKNH